MLIARSLAGAPLSPASCCWVMAPWWQRPGSPAPQARRRGRRRGPRPTLVPSPMSAATAAVQLPAAPHALARGQWSQVISKSGVTTADLLGGPVSLQAVTIPV
jgi:hypothetical protein